MRKYIICLLATMLFSLFVRVANAQYSIPSKMEWWYEARFGMFIHFGSYSYLGHGEWAYFTEKHWTKSTYQSQVTANFNPLDFDGGAIARLAKKAGMKYIVITAKHHEGFSMWDTEVESFKDVTGTKPFDLPGFTNFTKRDVLQELKDSCETYGIKFCIYYSILDWGHSSQEVNRSTYFSDMASMSARTDYINDMKLQVKELVTKYKPAVMWFDGDWTEKSSSPTLSKWWTKEDGIDLYNYVIGLDSTIIVNERVCRGFGLADFECPEREVPDSPRSRQWETCQTMNKSWGYKESDNSYKSAKTMIQELVKVVSRDGNYLLNIGPKGDGTVPTKSIELLEDIGDWMTIYGESLYGATRSPFKKEPSWGFCTKKPGKLFLHVCKWPTNGILNVPTLKSTINSINLMNDTTNVLDYSIVNGEIAISIPENSPNPNNSVIVINVQGVPEATIKVSRITVSSEGGSKKITSAGGTLQVYANVTPANAADTTYSWSVSDTTIATINSTGLLTAKADGYVYAIATANDGSNIKGSFKVTISGITTAVKELMVNNTVFLFPNPVDNGILNIRQVGNSTYNLAIYNTCGQQLLRNQMEGESFSLDVSELLPGIYSLTISNDKKVITKKFIRK